MQIQLSTRVLFQYLFRLELNIYIFFMFHESALSGATNFERENGLYPSPIFENMFLWD